MDAGIARDGLDETTVQVYGDWWASHGHPLGDYVLDVARSATSRAAAARARQFWTAHVTTAVVRGTVVRVRWVGGLIEAVDLSDQAYRTQPPTGIEEVVRSPLAALLRTIRFWTHHEEVESFTKVVCPASVGRVEVGSVAKRVHLAAHAWPTVRELRVVAHRVQRWPVLDQPLTRLELALPGPYGPDVPIAGVRELHMGPPATVPALTELLRRPEAGSLRCLGLHELPTTALAHVPETVTKLVWTPRSDELATDWSSIAARVPPHVDQVEVNGLAPDRALPPRFVWAEAPAPFFPRPVR